MVDFKMRYAAEPFFESLDDRVTADETLIPELAAALWMKDRLIEANPI
jgi:hypothetical protein